MKSYYVVWRMEIEADSHEDAARRALAIHRDPESIATVFDVCEAPHGFERTIDLTKIDHPETA